MVFNLCRESQLHAQQESYREKTTPLYKKQVGRVQPKVSRLMLKENQDMRTVIHYKEENDTSPSDEG